MANSEIQPEEVGAIPVPSASDVLGKSSALSRLSKELIDADLTHPGVHKLLIDRMERAESNCTDLERFRESFYRVDRELAVSRSEVDRLSSLDHLRSGTLCAGSLLLGYLPNTVENPGLGLILGAAGMGLLIAGYVTKPRKK